MNALLAWFLALALAFGSAAGLLYALAVAVLAMMGWPLVWTTQIWLAFGALVILFGLPGFRPLENFLRRFAFDLPSVEQANRLDGEDAISREAEDALARRLEDEIDRD